MTHTAQLDPWHAVTNVPDLTSSTEEHITFALQAAIHAPSNHNTQPWRFRVNGETIELFADRSRALFHLRVALRELGHDPVVTRIPGGGTPDLLARLELGAQAEPSAEDGQLLMAIPARPTNRFPFEQRSIPKRLSQELKHVVEREAAQLVSITKEEAKSHISSLIDNGDRLQWHDRRFRVELAAWTRANHSERHDGIPGCGLGHGEVSSVVSRWSSGPSTSVMGRRRATANWQMVPRPLLCSSPTGKARRSGWPPVRLSTISCFVHRARECSLHS